MINQPGNKERPKPDLPGVTLCMADCLHPQLALRALALSAAQCRFGAVKLFTHQPVDTPFEVTLVDPMRSKDDYSKFILKELCHHIDTSHVLVIQWDGYVLDASRWRAEFLQYDYIGAKWPRYPDRRIGNGGFSLRSRKLLQATSHMPDISDANEDLLICRHWGPVLEKDWGISFAPENVADQFSYEHALPDNPTFGFHGIGNMWRHVADDEMIGIINALETKSIFETEYASCMIAYLLQRRFDPFAALYRRWRRVMSAEEILKLFYDFGVVQQFADDCVRIGEKLMQEI